MRPGATPELAGGRDEVVAAHDRTACDVRMVMWPALSRGSRAPPHADHGRTQGRRYGPHDDVAHHYQRQIGLPRLTLRVIGSGHMQMWPPQTAARRSGHATDRGLDPGRADADLGVAPGVGDPSIPYELYQLAGSRAITLVRWRKQAAPGQLIQRYGIAVSECSIATPSRGLTATTIRARARPDRCWSSGNSSADSSARVTMPSLT